VGPCHNSTGRPRVADGGEGLRIWRVAANILNKQSRTADTEWSSSFGGERRANRPLPACYRILHKASELDGFFGTI
jgi:hypothetical protein